MRRLVVSVLTSLLAVTLLAAGCGDDTAPSGDPAPTTSPTESVAPTTAPSTSIEPPSTTGAPPTTVAPASEPPTFPAPAASTLEGILALGRPVVIGHAGGDQSWPHSTMYAFREAAVAGTDVLEMDVQLTADGVLIAQHDYTVEKTTEATDRVRDLTYDEIQALDNGYWWSSEWASHDLPADRYIYRGVRTGAVAPPEGYTADDFRVETFRAIAEAFPDHVLDVEIKIPEDDEGEPDLDFAIEGASVLAEEIEELGRTDSVIVVSFDDQVMAAFHEFAPDVATSPGLDAMTAWYTEGAAYLPSVRVLQIPPFQGELDVLRLPGFLENAAAEGLAVWVWPNDAGTQENPDFYEELVVEFGVDGALVGHPDLAVERYRELGLIP